MLRRLRCFVTSSKMSSLDTAPQKNNLTVSVKKCGIDFCPAKQDATVTGQAEDSSIQLLTWIYFAFGCASVFSIVLFLSKIPYTGEKIPLKTQLTSVFKMFTRSKIVLLMPITFFCGLGPTFMMGEYTKVS